MSTVTTSSPPGYVPMKNTLEEASLTQLVQELAFRLIGPEKARLLKSSGVNLDALCQALSPAPKDTSLSTPGSVLQKLKDQLAKEAEFSGTCTSHRPSAESEWLQDSWKQARTGSAGNRSPILPPESAGGTTRTYNDPWAWFGGD